jgi:hypothetical protein
VAYQHYLLTTKLPNSFNILFCSHFDLFLSILLNLFLVIKINSDFLGMLNCTHSKVLGCKLHQKRAIEERSRSFSMAEGDALLSVKLLSFCDFELMLFCVGENHMCYFFDESIGVVLMLNHSGNLLGVAPLDRLE